MPRFAANLILLLLGLSTAAMARPLLPSSETSAARLCIEARLPDTDIRDYCRIALGDGGMTPKTVSEVHVHLGYALENLGELDEAQAAYTQAVELDPTSTEALNSLAWFHWRGDSYAQARDHFQRSMDLWPTASSLAGMASIMGYVEGDYRRALELIDLSLALNEDYHWAIREKGWIQLSLADHDAALASFNHVLKREPEDANAHQGASRAFREMGRYDRALEHASRAIEISPGDVYNHVNRSYILRLSEKFGLSMKDAEAAIRIDPGYSRGYAELAFGQSALHRTSDAIATFEAGVEAGAGDNYLHYWFADFLSKQGLFSRAMEQIDLALAADGAGAADYEMKAYVAISMEEYELALSAANAALEIDESYAFAWYYRALAELGLGQTKQSVATLDRAVSEGLKDEQIDGFVSDLIRAGALLTALQVAAKYN